MVSPTSNSTLHMFSRLFLPYPLVFGSGHDSAEPLWGKRRARTTRVILTRPRHTSPLSSRPRSPRSWRVDRASRHASSAHHRNPSRTDATQYAAHRPCFPNNTRASQPMDYSSSFPRNVYRPRSAALILLPSFLPSSFFFSCFSSLVLTLIKVGAPPHPPQQPSRASLLCLHFFSPLSLSLFHPLCARYCIKALRHALLAVRKSTALSTLTARHCRQ